MKHSVERQGSAAYDQEGDDTRLVKASFDFNLKYVATFGGGGGAAAGSSEGATEGDGAAAGDREVADGGGAHADHDGDTEEEEDGLLVDDGPWTIIPGPFIGKLAPPSRQPKHVDYRVYVVPVPFDHADTPFSPCGELKFIAPGAPAEGIIMKLPSSYTGQDTCFVFKLKLSKAGATEDKVTINSLLYRDPPLESEQEAGDEEMAVDEMADGPDVEVEPSDRAASPTDSVRGGGEVRASSPSYPDWLHEQLEARSPRPALPVAEAANEMGEDDGPPTPVAGEPPVQVGAEQAAPPPPPVVVAPPPVAPALRSSGRERKRKQIYGANGELNYKASAFRSAPPLRKKSVSLDDETGVPNWAMPPNELWAKGFHAGKHAWFKAHVVKLRTQFPRIHVAFDSDEHGNTHALALPELSAYIHAADVRERDW